MKWRMVPGILFAFAALMLALDTCCLYARITAPDGTFLTGTAGGIGLYLFGGLVEVQEHLPYQYAPLYFFGLCAVTATAALAAVFCFWRARQEMPVR